MVSFRDEMWRADLRAIRKGTKFVTGPDGSRVADASFLDDITGRIVMQMIVSWSFGPPTPKDCQSEDLAQRMLDEKLSGKDWTALQMALSPWIDEVLFMPGGSRNLIHSATGATVTAASDADVERLLATGEFAPPAGAGPKSRLTATTTADLPAGQDQTPALTQ